MMTSHNTSDNNSTNTKSAKWSGKKRLAAIGIASVLAVGTFATVAYSGGGNYGKGHHMGGFMHSSSDPANFEKQLDKKMKFFAFGLDATDEQQERLKSVILSLAKDVMPMKAKMLDTRDQLHRLLTQPKIDRAAIENLRAEKIALVETISRKVSSAIADAGEILSVDQRIKLVKFMNKFGHGRRS